MGFFTAHAKVGVIGLDEPNDQEGDRTA